MNDFTIYPAIDLRRGRVVRLIQGDPERETAYAGDALAVARRWQQAGATWLHVVNLDGAFDAAGDANLDALAGILTTGLRVQFGGGLRDLPAIRRALDLGVERVVLGTVAVEEPALLEAALAAFGPSRIAVAIDARDGWVRTRGWQYAGGIRAEVLAARWAGLGGRRLVFTDIARDGTGASVNVAATAALAEVTGLEVIASGGVGELNDLRRVRKAGLAGVIVGRALYEGQIDLSEALEVGAAAGA
ncbi:MAG: 1-(5-phosphoribosyl)-5-[(5-phosphoribosylamino)methylideneamino]imidazole-4-carboxamide isomerase [Anaerolineales bacterium]